MVSVVLWLLLLGLGCCQLESYLPINMFSCTGSLNNKLACLHVTGADSRTEREFVAHDALFAAMQLSRHEWSLTLNEASMSK